MALPLPQLDQRTWADLVAEGLALAPRYGPAWTDQNASDPGVTLLELLAYKIEQSIYQANRVSSALLWRYLALAGDSALPTGVRAGRADLTFTLTQLFSHVWLPAGKLFLPRGGATEGPLNLVSSAQPDVAPLRLRQDVVIHPLSIQAVQTSDGRINPVDVTRLWHDEIPFPAWGDDPINPSIETAATYPPALFLALDQLPHPGEWLSIRVALNQIGPARDERERLVAALAARRGTPAQSGPRPIAGDSAAIDAPEEHWTGLPAHPDVEIPPGDDPPTTVVWEYYDGKRWTAFEAEDPTRGLTLDGTVRLRIPTKVADAAGMDENPTRLLLQVGAVPIPYVYIRCRLESGLPDVSPPIARIQVNTVELEQSAPALTTMPSSMIGPCLDAKTKQTYEDVPVLEFAQRYLTWKLPPKTKKIQVSADPALENTTVRVWRQDATNGLFPALVLDVNDPADDGSTTLNLITDASKSVIAESLRLVAMEPHGSSWALRSWTASPANDFVGVAPTARFFTLDPGSGLVTFGNGIHGRPVPPGTLFLAKFDYTAAGSGNPSPNEYWDVVGSIAYPLPRNTMPVVVPQTPLRGAPPAAPTSTGYDPPPLSDAAAPLGALNAALWLNREHGSTPPFVPFQGRSLDPLVSDPARAGSDAEGLDDAVARLARSTRTHVNLATEASLNGGTLDRLGLANVLNLAAPGQAVTQADLERLALGTPGANILRVRAFPEVDPDLPGLAAPGTVTLVIIPGLPYQTPEPSRSLLRRVLAYLQPLRGLGTRLRLVGPVYAPRDVRASLRIRSTSSAAIVRANAEKALRAWLDPVGAATPILGRDILRTEVLTVLAQVDGVTEVDNLTLNPTLGAPQDWTPWTLPTWGAINLSVEAAT